MEFINSIPAALGEQLTGYIWSTVEIGESSASVYSLEHSAKEPLFLKISDDVEDRELKAEAVRLVWIAGRLQTPRLVSFLEDSESAYLLTTALPGLDASNAALNLAPSDLVRLLARGLRVIHQLSIDACPFDDRVAARIEAARDRMLRGLVDESDFDDEREGKTAVELFEELLRTRPATEDPVFTHGDYCFPNIILDQGRISGFIDWSRGGVADRYQDLALAARSVHLNLGPDWTPMLFDEYGVMEPDVKKLEFYKLLDEFF